MRAISNPVGMTDPYLRKPISNGNPHEQALIRRWWMKEADGRGEIIWEYHVEGYFIDALWLPHSQKHGREHPGRNTEEAFPLNGRRVVLCEAKIKLTPELIGQALTYSKLAEAAGAEIEARMIFCQNATRTMRLVANSYGLKVIEHEKQ